MQLLHVQRSRMYASAALGAKGAKVRVLIQPKGAKTASTQPYMVWLLAASERDQGVNSDGKIAGGCKSSRHRKCFCWRFIGNTSCKDSKQLLSAAKTTPQD
mmetsp:Transcript_139043/g.277211  ORF Transcript_139043/g.277211 Transcript_139043/m.277211 type:complete len:101 (-) Transcript_139043:51-353(-)